MEKTQWEYECPKCHGKTYYKTFRSLTKARQARVFCNVCRNVRPRTLTSTVTEWFRDCPSCHKTIYYTSRGNLRRALKISHTCPQCHAGPDKATIKKISKSLSGKKYPNRKSNTKKGKILTEFRECPGCKQQLGYVDKYTCERATKSNAVCNSCSCRIYKKSWTHVIKDEHIKKMAAKKAGYDTFPLYMKDLDNRKKYYRKVRLITKKQDISLLENYDKLRGLCGVTNAYQLDHIISVSKGYTDKIAPEIIGDIKNLRIIPWRDNLLKSNK